MKTISDTIFEILREKKMTQKELAGKTGIAESTISDWKKKKNNPSADKILIICEVLEVSPYELLSGAEGRGDRTNDMYVIYKDTELGGMVSDYQDLSEQARLRILGYIKALKEIDSQ